MIPKYQARITRPVPTIKGDFYQPLDLGFCEEIALVLGVYLFVQSKRILCLAKPRDFVRHCSNFGQNSNSV